MRCTSLKQRATYTAKCPVTDPLRLCAQRCAVLRAHERSLRVRRHDRRCRRLTLQGAQSCELAHVLLRLAPRALPAARSNERERGA